MRRTRVTPHPKPRRGRGKAFKLAMRRVAAPATRAQIEAPVIRW